MWGPRRAADRARPARPHVQFADHALAEPPGGDAGAQADDLARELVAGDQRRGVLVDILEDVQIGAADTYRADGHQRLARGGHRIGALLDDGRHPRRSLQQAPAITRPAPTAGSQ